MVNFKTVAPKIGSAILQIFVHGCAFTSANISYYHITGILRDKIKDVKLIILPIIRNPCTPLLIFTILQIGKGHWTVKTLVFKFYNHAFLFFAGSKGWDNGQLIQFKSFR